MTFIKSPWVQAAVLLLVVILGIFNAGAINRQMHAWKLLPQPERLTELYYQDHTRLPASYVPGVPQSFTFATHNIEFRTVTYAYVVTQSSEDGGQSQELARGSFTLAQDGRHDQPVTVTPLDMGARSQIATEIRYSSQTSQQEVETIHYWARKEGA